MRLLSLPVLLLAVAPLAAQDPAAKITKTDTTLDFHAGKELVAKYQYAGTVQVEKGTGTKPLAKPFFFPLNAPGGVPVTRGWSMVRGKAGETTDHFHQKSVWFCHGDVIPEGLELKVKSSDKRVHGVDFWAESSGHGRIVCTEVGEVKAMGNHAMVPTKNEWRAPDGTKILDESRTIHLYTLPTGYLITLEIDLHASVCPITFGDTKEGSMGVRVPDEMRTVLATGGTVTSSNGQAVPPNTKGTLPVWGEIADWHDYSGKASGVAIFADPMNAHPSAWHTRDYGLMAANPFGRKDSGFPSQKDKTELAKMAKGDHLKLRFGVYAHRGDATAGKVAEVFKQFAGK